MKFLSGYNIKIVVQWGEFSARGGGLPLIPSVGKPWDGCNFAGGSLPGGFSWWEGDNLQLVWGTPYPQ